MADTAKFMVVYAIYERDLGSGYPVLTHSFYGKTLEEAEHYHDSHRGTDEFMRSCEDSGRWNDVECYCSRAAYQRGPDGSWVLAD